MEYWLITKKRNKYELECDKVRYICTFFIGFVLKKEMQADRQEQNFMGEYKGMNEQDIKSTLDLAVKIYQITGQQKNMWIVLISNSIKEGGIRDTDIGSKKWAQRGKIGWVSKGANDK